MNSNFLLWSEKKNSKINDHYCTLKHFKRKGKKCGLCNYPFILNIILITGLIIQQNITVYKVGKNHMSSMEWLLDENFTQKLTTCSTCPQVTLQNRLHIFGLPLTILSCLLLESPFSRYGASAIIFLQLTVLPWPFTPFHCGNLPWPPVFQLIYIRMLIIDKTPFSPHWKLKHYGVIQHCGSEGQTLGWGGPGFLSWIY